MFTGIIRYTGKVKKIISAPQGKRFLIETKKEFIEKLEKGISSVAINGSCHTVEEITENGFIVFSSFETLKKTTLSKAKINEVVNLENSLTLQSFLDGHIVLGHVDGIGRITEILKKGEAYLFRFSVPEEIYSYLVEKDSIAVDGISLTMFNVKNCSFDVAIIPQTISETNLSYKKTGSEVNLEINIFAKYAIKFLLK